MLLELDPGLVCKKCGTRIKLARDVPDVKNLVLREKQDQHEGRFKKINGDFTVGMSCAKCSCVHTGTGFIRDGIFKGIYEYNSVSPQTGGCLYDGI